MTMLEAITNAGEIINGGDSGDFEAIADAWTGAGFGVDDAAEWWESECWDAGRTAELRAAGFEPGEAGKRLKGRTVGFWFCNCDLSINQVRDLIQGGSGGLE